MSAAGIWRAHKIYASQTNSNSSHVQSITSKFPIFLFAFFPVWARLSFLSAFRYAISAKLHLSDEPHHKFRIFYRRSHFLFALCKHDLRSLFAKRKLCSFFNSIYSCEPFLRNLSRAGRKNHFQLANHNNTVGKFKIPLQSSSRCFDRKKVVAWLQFIHLFPLSSTLVKRAWKAAGKAYRTCCRRLKWNLISNVPQITSTVQVDASARSEMKILFLVYEF